MKIKSVGIVILLFNMPKLGLGKRSFTVVTATHVDGCSTKHHTHSRLISREPAGAARKAFSELCNLKKIKGACAFYIRLKETTQGSTHKMFLYHCHRVKLDKPVQLPWGLIEYGIKTKSVKSIPSCKKSHKSSGRMRSKSLRK